MDPVGAAASALTLVAAAKQIFDLIRDLKHAPAELVFLANEATDWKLAMHDVSVLAKEPNFVDRHGSNLTLIIDQVNVKVAKLQAFVAKLQDPERSKAMGRIKWVARHKKEAGQLLDELAVTRQSLSTLLAAHAARDSSSTLQSLENIAADQVSYHRYVSQGLEHLDKQSKASTVGIVSEISSLRVNINDGQEQSLTALRHNSDDLTAIKDQLSELAEDFAELSKTSTSTLAQHSQHVLAIMNKDNNRKGDESPVITEKSSSEVSFIMRGRQRQTCLRSCPCACHTSFSLSTPQALKGITGFLFADYYGTFAGKSSCNSSMCKANKGFDILATYAFPQWLLAKAFTIAISNIQSREFTIRLRTTTFTQDGKLRYLVQTGNLEAVQRVLKSKAVYIDERDEFYGQTALWTAVLSGHYHLAKLLLSEGADPDAQDYYHNTPKSLAHCHMADMGKGALETPKRKRSILHECFWDEGEKWSAMRYTVLHEIVLGLRKGSLEEELIKSRDHINDVDASGFTALCTATRLNQTDDMRVLLKYGADPDIGENEGSAPIVYAANLQNDTTAMHLLLKARASVAQVKNTGFTPLLHASWHQDSAEHLVPLIEAGNDPNDKEVRGFSCLCRAASNDRAGAAKVLIEYGADINDVDCQGYSILATAVAHGSDRVLKLLLDKGAVYNTLNDSKQNILHVAADSEKTTIETLRILRNFKLQDLDANARDYDGHTPLDLLRKRHGLEVDAGSFKEAFYALIDSVKPRKAVFEAVSSHNSYDEDIIKMSLLG